MATLLWDKVGEVVGPLGGMVGALSDEPGREPCECVSWEGADGGGDSLRCIGGECSCDDVMEFEEFTEPREEV